jgi:hypothetical protein
VRRPGDHEELVLPNRTYPGESQGGVAISNQATTALCSCSSRITRCTSICRIQGGGDPGDYQFFNEPPKEVPHGYACAYIPDNSNPIRSIQQAAVGVSGMDADKHAWLAKYTTGPSHDNTYSAPAILRDQFGILPKRRMIGYTKPYPSDYDLIPLPPKYRLPKYTKFNGSEGSSSIEHVSRYLAQLGMISVSYPLRVRFFLHSLTGPAFGWYTSLGPDSIRTWKQLEEQFHIQYHSEAAKARIADLAQVRQKRGETVVEYIQRFREVKTDAIRPVLQKMRRSNWHPWVWQSQSWIWASNWSSILCTFGSKAKII